MSISSRTSEPVSPFDAFAERSTRVMNDPAKLGTRSETAISRLRATRRTGKEPEPQAAAEATPSDRRLRQHVIIVNSVPAFLDAARVILQGDQYNVTTTNLIPSTYDMTKAVGVDVLIIDLALDLPSIWALVDQLRQGTNTRALPIVFTATRPELLDRAQEQGWRAGGNTSS